MDSSSPARKPLVIAHRGASGYRPENTLEAFELGLALGADGIEFDVVNTLDQELIIRHENALSKTTDISERSEFMHLKRAGVLEGRELVDWFTEDLTLAEIKTLRAKERIPDIRPGSSKFDGQFEIPTLNQVLESEFVSGKVLVVELKRGSHLVKLTSSLGKLAAAAIAQSPVVKRGVSLILESFDFNLLLEAKHELARLKVDAKFFYALDSTKIKDINLSELAEDFDGLSIATHMLASTDTWVSSCHEVGLDVWVYTARAEKAENSIEEYYEHIIQTGVDGIFADQPDLLRRVLEDRG